MMKTPVGLVTIALSAATLLAGTLLLVTGTRGQNTSFQSSAGQLDVQTFASGLVHPWALAFLPDGKLLVTERPGRMRIVSAEGQLSPPLKNVPEVWASGQGGLLDVITDKDFALARKIEEVVHWQPGLEGGPLEGTPGDDQRFRYIKYD